VEILTHGQLPRSVLIAFLSKTDGLTSSSFTAVPLIERIAEASGEKGKKQIEELRNFWET